MGWRAFGPPPPCLFSCAVKRTECAANPSTILGERRERDGGGVVDKETRRRKGKRGLQKKSAIDLAADTNVYCVCV